MKNRKEYMITIVLLVGIMILGGTRSYASSGYEINYTGNGTVRVISQLAEKGMRIQVQKGDQKYNYIYDTSETKVPLQLGKGTYTIKVLKNIEGNRYKVVTTKNITYDGEVEDKIIYTQSINKVSWKDYNIIKELSDKLTTENMTDMEKTKVFYNYITKNIKYDYDKVKRLTPTYMPEIVQAVENNRGICYDYSSLYAGLLRYNDIPTKLVTGYASYNKTTYHAWNEVFLDNEWKTMDLTYDAMVIQNNGKTSKFKIKEKYNKDKEY